MNRQYLKTLQQRAQKLLQISSDQQQQLNFNISKTKSRRLDLNQYLSNTNLNQLNTQFQEYRNTDVQLLKRCISLTNQNTQLKTQLKTYQTQRIQLKAQTTFLQNQLDNYKLQLARVRQRSSQKIKGDQTPHSKNVKGNQSPFNKLNQIDHFSFIQKNPIQSLKYPVQSLKQKSQSMSKFGSSKYSQPNQQMYTNKQIQRIQQRYNKQISQLEQRLKVANQKKQEIQKILMKQKQKSKKLWRFINNQIPQLKDIITNLTNKVDLQVQSILLKDINQEQFNRKRIKRSNKTIQNVY